MIVKVLKFLPSGCKDIELEKYGFATSVLFFYNLTHFAK